MRGDQEPIIEEEELEHEEERQVEEDQDSFEFEEGGDPEREVTIDEFYNHAGFGKSTILNSVGAGMALFMFGAMIEYIILICQYLQCQGQLSLTAAIAVKILTILGMIIGLPLSGFLSDRIERVKVALSGAYFVFIFWTLSALSASLLFVTFFCVGAGFSALLPSSIVFAFEYSSFFQHTRVALILFLQYILGQIYCLLLFYTLVPVIGWNWVTVMIGLPTAFLLAFYHTTPDTPKYYLISGRGDLAYLILLLLHKEHKRPMLRGKLKDPGEITDRGACCGPCSLLFLRPTLLLLALFFLLFFAYYTTTYGLYMSLRTTDYCNSGDLLEEDLCEEQSLSDSNMLDSLISLFPDLVGLMVGLFLAETLTRRVSILFLVTAGGVVALAAIYCISTVANIVEMGVVRAAAYGAFVLVFLAAVESYTTNIRCLGLSYLLSVGLVGMYAAGTLTLALRASSEIILLVLGLTLLVAILPAFSLGKEEKKDVDSCVEEQIPLN